MSEFALSAWEVREAAILLFAADAVISRDAGDRHAGTAQAARISRAVDEDPLWANGRHFGDCTKEPQTCDRCLIEEYEAAVRLLEVGDEFIPAALRAGVVTPPEHGSAEATP